MLPRSSRREEGRLLQSWEAQTCGRSPSSHLLCCLCSRLCYWELCEPHPAPPSSRAVPAESQLLSGLTLGANTGSAQETWAKHGPMREKCMHENFSDGLSFSSWISSACLFSKLKINSYTLPVRFIIPQVKIPFLSQSKDAGREREFLHAFLLWVSWDLKRTVKLSVVWCGVPTVLRTAAPAAAQQHGGMVSTHQGVSWGLPQDRARGQVLPRLPLPWGTGQRKMWAVFLCKPRHGSCGEQDSLCWPVGARQGKQRVALAAPHCWESSLGELPSPGVHLEGGCKSNLSARVH